MTLGSSAQTLRLSGNAAALGARPNRVDLVDEHEPPPLLGLFRVGTELGRGGMGLVYSAKHLFTGRRVALKILPRWAARDGDYRARFERENAALRALSHASTVRALTPVECTRGWYWYAMERVVGASVHELLRAHGRFDGARVSFLFAEIAGALAEAHSRGLVHRDLKPANVMLARPGPRGHERAKLLDFGLVRDMYESPELRISRRDLLLGTPGFLAPEGYESPLSLDARSDVFALGLVGHAMLTGTRRYGTHPPQDASLALSGAECHDARYLLAAIRCCLEPDQRRRPRDAGDVLAMLPKESTQQWPDWAARAWWDAR